MPKVKISEIRLDPNNVRLHDHRNIEAIKSSLSRFGQQKPIVVGSDGTVFAGNGTLEAAKLLGWDRINVIRSTLSKNEAAAFAIADNRASDLSMFDEAELVLSLKQIESFEGIDLEDVGYSADDFQNLVEAMDQDPTPEDFKDYDENIPTEHECPKCSYKWSGSSS
tara:strand:+ start:1707 stop:2204 length:498 start_codon:yes stop_codon:yes gene_type:complete